MWKLIRRGEEKKLMRCSEWCTRSISDSFLLPTTYSHSFLLARVGRDDYRDKDNHFINIVRRRTGGKRVESRNRSTTKKKNLIIFRARANELDKSFVLFLEITNFRGTIDLNSYFYLSMKLQNGY